MSSVKTNNPLVISVILNTNRRQDLLVCLASLEKSDYLNHKIIVLDNASSDGSVEATEKAFSEVEISKLSRNLGYAGNNNVGIAHAVTQGAEWIFVLNEDTVVAQDCLSKLISAGESDPRIGITGPLVYNHDEALLIQSAGGRLDRYWRAWHLLENELDEGQYSQTHEVDWISGCAIMVRRDVIEEVGALDERFFYYWEETEWCLRAHKQGWRIVHVPLAKLWHKGVQRDYRPSAGVTYYNTRNRFFAMAKHNAPLVAWLIAWVQTLRTLTIWSIKPTWRNKRDHRDAMWQGIVDFLRGRWGMRPT